MAEPLMLTRSLQHMHWGSTTGRVSARQVRSLGTAVHIASDTDVDYGLMCPC